MGSVNLSLRSLLRAGVIIKSGKNEGFFSLVPGSNYGKEPMSPDDDPLYEKATLVAKSNPRLCVANLQRTLAIGYNRAHRLMETMIGEGLVERFDTGLSGVGYRLVATK